MILKNVRLFPHSKDILKESRAIWNLTGDRHTKLAWNERFRKDFNRLKKQQYRNFSQIITGHAGLNYHLHKMKLVDSPLCENCGYEPETVSHFLGQCPAFGMIRGEVFNTFHCTLTDIKFDQSVATITKYINRTKRLAFSPSPNPAIHTTYPHTLRSPPSLSYSTPSLF